MKAVFALTFVCFVAAANAEVFVNYDGVVDSIVKEMTDIAEQTAEILEHKYEEIILEPVHQVEVAVQQIEERREKDSNCVAAKDTAVEAVVDTMHSEMNVCGKTAAKTSASIMIDIIAATQQLIFDGYDVAKTYQKCKNYKNSVLKNSCYARLSIKATLYLKNARKSIKTIKENTNKRVPAVFTDAESCTHTAADSAVGELDNIQADIDACIVKGH